MLQKHGIFNQVWLMDPSYAVNYLPIIAAYIKHGHSNQFEKHQQKDFLRFAARDKTVHAITDYGYDVSPEDAPEDSVAIIDISDAITKHSQNCGPAGMLVKSNILRRCYANDNIKGIVLNVDSGGGEGMAMRLMAETIKDRNKPVIGFIDDYACSAAYGILAACDVIVANSDQARIGSIGTYITIADYTGYFEKQGIKLTDVYASESTEKNMEYREALKGNLKPVQAIANQFNDYFLNHVQESRGDHLADKKAWGTGKVFFAKEAKELGLIDAIDTFQNILNYF